MNKVELCGIVGSVRSSKVADKIITYFSLATSEVSMTESGPVTTTTWHNVTHFSNEALDMEKGNVVSVIGRNRNNNYTGVDGQTHYLTEIRASHVEVHKDANTLEYETI